ncbi:mobile element protein [Hydrogenimonas sp.]|jgi:putative transposase|nr:mobile element protein [Hydrogenimonas sp.]BBG65740.1 mobile element protein [Hydrogenimonas sp.]BBG65864.1 mobile element protein [Hydrogenimonas sp.]BBG66476.1 mobile element protein [Hydrogenimonas sp.]BBG66597.1 mobile element protein [Hydrogenimonas sp.]
MKKRFSEEQIVKILQEAERAATDQEVIRKHNISDTTFYRWKKLYGGMGVSEVKRLKELERENARLKKLLAEQILVNDALKDVVEKKW